VEYNGCMIHVKYNSFTHSFKNLYCAPSR